MLDDETIYAGLQAPWLPRVSGSNTYMSLLEALLHGCASQQQCSIMIQALPHAGALMSSLQVARIRARLLDDRGLVLLVQSTLSFLGARGDQRRR